MKLLIWAGVFVGGLLGGWIGALLAGGNWISAASILLSSAGSLAGIWAGYKISKEIGL